MAKEETPVAFCVAESLINAAGSADVLRRRRTPAVRPTLLPRTFQCAVKILIGVLACCLLSAAPDVTHEKKGVLPGNPVVWAAIPLGMYAWFLWYIVRLGNQGKD